MKEYILKIPTRRWNIAALLFGMVVCVWLCVMGYVPLAGKMSAEVLFLLCFVTLLSEWRTIYIRFDVLCVRHNLILLRRSIPIDRVSSVEVFVKDREYTLLIALDDCPSFKSEKCSNWESYVLKHPIKVICLPCDKDDAFRCLAYFKDNGTHTDIIYKFACERDLRSRD